MQNSRLENLIHEYALDHQNKRNQALHTIGIPIILFSLLGLFSLVTLYGPFKLAHLLALFSLCYYARLSFFAFLYMAVIFLSTLFSLPSLFYHFDHSLFLFGLLLVIGLFMQFLGHYYEGKRPSFFKDLRFLLIGPLWVLKKQYIL